MVQDKTSTATSATKIGSKDSNRFDDKSKSNAVRESNITAAKSVADAIRTSLGPRGMDKMIQEAKGDVTITNDGATILKQMKLLHPAAKMLVELSKAQDIEAGDGTTTVVVIAGSLLDACSSLLAKGIHPTVISDAFQAAATKASSIITKMTKTVDLNNKELLNQIASTSLNSKVVSQYSSVLAPIAVNSVLSVVDPEQHHMVSLKDVRVIKKLGGTIEDTKMFDGLILKQKVEAGEMKKIEKAKIGLIQFCCSPPKTDMENTVIVSDYMQMDRIMKEERQYILNIVKAIKKAGCNVLLIQKSILRDAINDLALHYFAKMKIMVIKDIEREEIEFVCKTLKCTPIASLDHFLPEALGTADLVEEFESGGTRIVKICGIQNKGRTVSVLVRGSNKLVLDEAERSLHDALCVIRCLVRNKALLAGGGAPEIEVAQKLAQHANTLQGLQQYCLRAYADALEIVPYTLAENAGLNPIRTVTELRAKHAAGEVNCGINVRKGCVSDMLAENVMQPALVTLSALNLATETVRSILKIDDVINAMGARF